MVIRADPDGRVHLMHSLFFVWVDLYSTQGHMFVCLCQMPAKPPPPVVDIPDKAFLAQRSVRFMPQLDLVTHLGGISPLYWQTKPCERSVNNVGTEYMDLACQRLTFVPLNCAYSLLQREADGAINVFEALKDLFPLRTG